MPPRLFALHPGAPAGFESRETLAVRDVRAGVFALWARSPEEAEAGIPAPLDRVLGVVVTEGETASLVRRPSGLYHLTLAPAPRPEDTVLFVLGLLEHLETGAQECQRLRLELERSLQDSHRHAKEYQEFRDSLLREIADRRTAEEALRESEQRLTAIYDSVSDAILIHDPESGEVLQGNRSARLLFGSQDLSAPGRLGAVALADLRAAGESPRVVDWRVRRPAGEEIWVEASLRRTVVSGREVVLVTARDVSERKATEEERRRLEDQLQHTQRLESLGVLAGGVAHDFNNLLMAIQGNADLALCDLPSESPARRPLCEVLRASQSAADLCRQILTYAGRGRLDLQPVDLSELVPEIGRMLEVSVSHKARLQVCLEPDLPPVLGDPTQLRQILMNLILNASEAMAERGGEIRVSIAATSCGRAELGAALLGESCAPGQYLVLEVSDTGCGMDAETVRRIFEPFFSTKTLGRGLGLAAVLGIVRGHRGALRVDSEPGQGTRFRVFLPVLGGPLALARPTSASPGAPAAPRAGTVLVVDDEDLLRTLLRETLERQGFRVISAEDGATALQRFRETPDVDLVLLDLRMPRMDGVETCREIRRLSGSVPVLMMSGHQDGQMLQGVAGLEIQGFLQKPFRASELGERLQQILG